MSLRRNRATLFVLDLQGLLLRLRMARWKGEREVEWSRFRVRILGVTFLAP